jgi:hypothetical protein
MNPARDHVLMVLVVCNICKEYYKFVGKNRQGRGHYGDLCMDERKIVKGWTAFSLLNAEDKGGLSEHGWKPFVSVSAFSFVTC